MIDYNGERQSSEHTYFAVTPTTLVCPAGTKSFFMMMGSATKIIRITKIHVSGFTMTARAYHNINLRRISSAPSGGTYSSLVKVPTDSQNESSTISSCYVYTAEPTTDGTLVGNLQSYRMKINDTNPVQGDPQAEIQFNISNGYTPGIILRGTSEGLSLAFGTTPASAITLSLEIEWTEIN